MADKVPLLQEQTHRVANSHSELLSSLKRACCLECEIS